MGIRYKPRFLMAILTLAIIFLSVNLPCAGALGDAKPFLTGEINEKDGRLVDAAFYAKNFGVTVDEALRRFSLEDAARSLEAELSTIEAETFAGLWVKHTPEFRIVVQFTRDVEDIIKPYIPKNLADAIEIRTVKSSYIDLQNARTVVTSSLKNLNVVSDSYIDIIENYVNVSIAQVDQTRFENAVQNERLTLPDNVKVVTVDTLAKPVIDIYGGLAITTCTSGFAVKTPGGTKGIVTAGHADNFQWYYYIIPWYLFFQQERMDTNYDVQWHTCPGLTVVNKIRWWSDGSTFDITATRHRNNQLVGETVSKYGKTTYYTAGTIYSKDAQMGYIPNCSPTFILVQDTYGYGDIALPGDSGGPWFRGNTAYGITCAAASGWAWYMAVNYVDVLGVSVMTSP